MFLQSRSARRMWGTRRSWMARRRSRRCSGASLCGSRGGTWCGRASALPCTCTSRRTVGAEESVGERRREEAERVGIGKKWFGRRKPRKLGVKSSTNVRGRGCRTRARDESIRGYLGWKDAHPGALIEVREPSVSAPVAAVVGVVPGAALPALPGDFGGAPEHPSAAVTGPGGGVPAFDVESDGRRLGGAPLRATGRDRLFGGRHVKSGGGGGADSWRESMMNNVMRVVVASGDVTKISQVEFPLRSCLFTTGTGRDKSEMRDTFPRDDSSPPKLKLQFTV